MFVSVDCSTGNDSRFKHRHCSSYTGRFELMLQLDMVVQTRPNVNFPRSGTSRAFNRGADTRRSYTKAEKKIVVTFYLQQCREHGEVEMNKTKRNENKNM